VDKLEQGPQNGIGSLDRQPVAGGFAMPLTAPARPDPRKDSAAFRRNLILAYRPGWQSLDDLRAIGEHVRRLDPTIAVFVVPQTSRSRRNRAFAAGRPTLVVSAGEIMRFRPARGRVYQGVIIPKMDEIARMRTAGLPVPRTALLTPGMSLDPAEWGDLVVLKPTDIASSSLGRGIQLTRAARVSYRHPAAYPPAHPGRLGPMMVQQFVDTGERIAVYRVLTFFGEPLYALLEDSPDARVPRDAPDEQLERATVASQATQLMECRFIDEPDVLALARAAHQVIPGVPLKGVDILREKDSGKLYVLELNCGGNTWHFSSAVQAGERAANGPEFRQMLYAQFDAMQTAARVLVARTNAEAE
jgi:hypothetical protein